MMVSGCLREDLREAMRFASYLSQDTVWKVVIGGNKVSRGYTVEGLTISYYRRVAGTADTLMQMGRWFGFRPGYRDLVRLFIGWHKPLTAARRRFVDIYEVFEAICR